MKKLSKISMAGIMLASSVNVFADVIDPGFGRPSIPSYHNSEADVISAMLTGTFLVVVLVSLIVLGFYYLSKAGKNTETTKTEPKPQVQPQAQPVFGAAAKADELGKKVEAKTEKAEESKENVNE